MLRHLYSESRLPAQPGQNATGPVSQRSPGELRSNWQSARNNNQVFSVFKKMQEVVLVQLVVDVGRIDKS